MDCTRKEITYFKYCGEANTQEVLEAARKRCEEGISTVVIASETGRSALKAVNVFQGTEVDLIVVTHYPASTWGPKGDIPIGLMRDIYEKTRQTLIESGARIVQSTRPFAPPSRSIEWKYPTPEGIIDKTLEIFGAGTKIAVEAALMATDAGVTGTGEEVISCAGTYKGLDTALVVRTTFTMDFFAEFEIREIIARPRHRVRKLPEYTYEDWKGDLDQYYEGLESGQK